MRFDKRWHNKLRRYVEHILVVTDCHFDCDVLLDQIYGRVEIDCQQLVPDN